MTESADVRFMSRALELAERGIASTDPNPAVGCVIVSNGSIVGEGFTQRPGGNHAEIEALDAAGDGAVGATVYVSLEPCSHQGRTGPCAVRLIDAKVARVVYAVDDPNPAVAGDGAKALRAAGIDVVAPLLAEKAEAVNRGFFSRHRRRRPWIRLKMAASLDGRTALANGQSQWITGPEARRDVHRWRARSSAVMTGIGTVLADDPRLTARVDDADIDIVQPVHIVIDSNLRTPPDARLIDGGHGGAIVFAGADGIDGRRRERLLAAGARIETVNATPRCDLAAIAGRLAELELNEIWVEAGPTLAGAMVEADLVDEVILYLAPCLLGTDARGLFELEPLTTLDARRRLSVDRIDRFGEDIRLIARMTGG